MSKLEFRSAPDDSALDEAETHEGAARSGSETEHACENARAVTADATSAQAQRELHLRKGEELIHSLL